MGPSGMHSFGHAAYFGLGAYGAALCFKAFGLPMEASLLLAPLLAALGAFVFGWFCVRLSGVYLAMLTLAFAQIVWSVVFQWDARHRRQQRPGRHLALGLAGAEGRVLPARARLHRRRRGPARPHAARAARHGAAREPRLAVARRRDRHRRAAPAVDRVRRRRHRGRPRRRAVRLRQGNDLARDARRRQVGRRPRDGAARRRARGLGAVGRRRALHLAAGHGRAPDRLLARAARHRHAGAHPRSFRSASPAASSGSSCATRCRHERAAARRRGPGEVVRRRARGRRRELRARRRRDARADRPERRRQDDLLQHGRRPARARCRLGAARRRRARRPAGRRRSGARASAAPSRSPRPSPRSRVRENVQLALLSHARRVLGFWRAARTQFVRRGRCAARQRRHGRRRPSGR